MSANRNPIFTKNGRIASVLVTLANTSSQGGGTIATDIFLLFTPGAEGSYVEEVQFVATATAPTTTTATTGRLFISTQSAGATTSANTFLLGEVSLPATGADSATVGVSPYSIPVGFVIPTGFFLLVTNHATPAANSAWRANVIGAGDY